MKFVLCALLSLLLMSCGSLRNEVSPGTLIGERDQLVVTCYLSPQDTVLAVKVTRSQSVLEDELQTVSSRNVVDATVTLSDGSRSAVLPYDNTTRPQSLRPYYNIRASAMPIIVGRTYTLTVVTPQGERATSTCTIPGAVNLTGVTFDSLQSGNSQRYFVRARWRDEAGRPNYYQTTGVFWFTADCATCPKDTSSLTTSDFTYLSFDDDNRGLFMDTDLDGAEMISGRAYLNGSNLNPGLPFMSRYQKASVTVNLLNVEQTYYQFWSAVVRQRRVRNNPFAEPVIIPSNIQGGLGCFAGYNTASKNLVLR